MIINASDIIVFRKRQGVDVDQRAPGIRVNAGKFFWILSLDQVENCELIFSNAYIIRDFQDLFRMGHRVLPGKDQLGSKSFLERGGQAKVFTDRAGRTFHDEPVGFFSAGIREISFKIPAMKHSIHEFYVMSGFPFQKRGGVGQFPRVVPAIGEILYAQGPT